MFSRCVVRYCLPFSLICMNARRRKGSKSDVCVMAFSVLFLILDVSSTTGSTCVAVMRWYLSSTFIDILSPDPVIDKSGSNSAFDIFRMFGVFGSVVLW